jgi:hypothetical protein
MGMNLSGFDGIVLSVVGDVPADTDSARRLW